MLKPEVGSYSGLKGQTKSAADALHLRKEIIMERDKYKNLRYRLMESETWPLEYMFKFITPNKDGNVEQIKALLPEHGKISYKHTSNLAHVAITCVATMQNADEIVEVTEKVGQIEGVIVL